MLNRGHSRRLSPRAAARGFTLVELGVVLVVLGLALTAVVPTMIDWVRSLRVRGAAESMVAGLDRARVEALRRNREVAFWLVTAEGNNLTSSCATSASSASWVVSESNPAGACEQAPDIEKAPFIVAKHASNVGTSLAVAAAGPEGEAATHIIFNGLGRVVSNPSYTPIRTIDVKYEGSTDVRALRVQVTAGGLVRLCDPSVPAADSRACL